MAKRYVISLSNLTLENIFNMVKRRNGIRRFDKNFFELEMKFNGEFNDILLYVLDNKIFDNLEDIYENTILLELPDDYSVYYDNYPPSDSQDGFIIARDMKYIKTYTNNKIELDEDIKKYAVPYNKE